MLTRAADRSLPSYGFTLLEVLITIIVLAFGMLGLANLQTKIHLTEVESYQRAQAVVLLQDMVDRIAANNDVNAVPNYDTGAAVGGGGATVDCNALPMNTPAQLVNRDLCEWTNALNGAAEERGGANVGAMIGARGCIDELQAPNDALGVCTPGIYRVTVVWQGLHSTAVPSLGCAAGQYGADDSLRRAISTQVTIGLPQCTPP